MNQQENSTITSLSLNQINSMVSQQKIDDGCQIDGYEIDLISTVAMLIQQEQKENRIILLVTDGFRKLRFSYIPRKATMIEDYLYYKFIVTIRNHKNGRFIQCIGMNVIENHNLITLHLLQIIQNKIERNKNQKKRQSFPAQSRNEIIEQEILDIFFQLQGNKGITQQQLLSALIHKYKEKELLEIFQILRHKNKVIVGSNPFMFFATK